MFKKHFLKLKFLTLSILDEEIEYYAASLSFYTIFAIIPLLLLALSIFANLPTFEAYYQNIKSFIFSNIFPNDTEIISNYIDSFMQNSVKMGVMGFIYILITSFLFFKNYEYIVSKIFDSNTKSFWESITIYWTLITLTPIGILISFSLTDYIQKLINSSVEQNFNFLIFLPYLIIWFLFFIVYRISINVKLRVISILISSFLVSLIWYSAKSLFLYYVFYNKTYSTIYGSFSSIIFFFLWIYFSWIIFLYGLKMTKVIERRFSIET